MNPSSVLDGNYLVPGGVERLVLEWKVTRGRWIDKRDGIFEEKDRLSPEFKDLLYKAGSAKYKPGAPPEGIAGFEWRNLTHALAPYESDGVEDSNEWNLFSKYVDPSPEASADPHNLSMMLHCWRNDVVSYCKPLFL